MKSIYLTDWIKIDRSAARSVNLERDFDDSIYLERFQVTPNVLDVLNRFADSLEGESVNSWSLTGPYGTGKTAFCNFLLEMFCGNELARNVCFEKLNNADRNLSGRFHDYIFNKDIKFIGVRGVSHYEPLNSTLSRAIAGTIQSLNDDNHQDSHKCQNITKLEELYQRVVTLTEQVWPETRDIISIYKELVAITKCKLLVVIDEFGKNLEYQAYNKSKGDIFALQALAESKEIYLWVCLHQSFSEYAGSLTKLQQEEWQKIQGRFEDKAYIEPPYRTFELLGEFIGSGIEAIDGGYDSDKKVYIEKWAKEIHEVMDGIRLHNLPPLSIETISRIYPIHPLCAYFMGELTRRFAQNDRTLFSFLSSGEPTAFTAFIKSRVITNPNHLPTLQLDYLYDYFSDALNTRYGNRSENQRWLEIQSIIFSHSDIGAEKVRLLKIIGIINLLGSIPGISASRDFIYAAMMPGIGRKELDRQLNELRRDQVLIYRNYANEYRLWEGSDIDIDTELVNIRSQVALKSMQDVLNEVAPKSNIIAARHSYQTGTLREFHVKWCIEENFPELIKQPAKNFKSDGILYLAIGKQSENELIYKIASSGRPVIVAYSDCFDQVRALMIEAAATRMLVDAPQLQRDGIARKEALHRASKASEMLQNFINNIFTPGDNSTVWIINGEKKSITSARSLSSHLSDVCDRIYPLCPRINNEMLNCERLSASGAKARREVAEGFTNSADQETLGFSGCGPEVAVYRSVFKDTGLHVKTDEGWMLMPPSKDGQPQFAAIWDKLDEMLNSRSRSDIVLGVREAIDVIKAPPFGLKEGPAPLIIVHYLVYNSDRIAVYEEGVFKPFFGDAEASLLMKRPELFSLRKYTHDGIKKDAIQAYLYVINEGAIELSKNVRNQSILSIVVPLTEFIKSLPEYTLSTRDLSPDTLRLRNAIQNAKDPQMLLFKSIPEALGFDEITDDNNKLKPSSLIELRDSLWSALSELKEKFEKFFEKIKKITVNNLSLSKNSGLQVEEFREEIYETTKSIIKKCGDSDLKPILATMANDSGDDDNWIMRIAAQIMKKPVTSWKDTDVEPYSAKLGELRERITGLSKLVSFSEKPGRSLEKTRFLSVTMPDGRILAKTVNVDSGFKDLLKQKHQDLFERNNNEYRNNLLAVLLEIMEKEGDFK